MGISKTEAASALSDIEQTTGRSHELRGYRIAGPILTVWGVIWIVGYLAMGLLPQKAWGVWLPLDVVGVVLTILLARRGPAAARTGIATGWRSMVGGLTVAAFIAATFALFRPTSPDVLLAYPGVVCGAIYVVAGLWRMTRFVWVGAAIAAASLVGFYFFQPWLAFWMAAVGGGGLLLGGLWMRRA